ncbi:MAG: hypothetical protein IJ294_03445, partial [Clostridia bacterium]|nr:hypothetical protein [Clostridia bacterium]
MKGAAKKLSGMIEANMEGADPAEIKRAKRIFRKVLTAQTLTLEEAATIAKDERLLSILEGMMGEELLGKDLSPRQIAALARLASFTDENGKVSKARLALFKDAFGEIDTKAIEQILKYDALTEVLEDGVLYENENTAAALDDNQQEAVETLNALSEMTGFRFLITENHKTGDFLASGLMAVNPNELNQGIFYAVGHQAYQIIMQLHPEVGDAIRTALLQYAEQSTEGGVVEENIKLIQQQAAAKGRDINDDMAKNELCARMLPGILLSSIDAEQFAKENPDEAARLYKVFGAIKRYLFEMLKNRKLKTLENGLAINYNTTKVNTLGGISDEKAAEEQGTRETSYNDGRNGQDNSLHNGRMGPNGVDQEDSRDYTDDDGTANIGHTRKGRNVGWGMDSDGRGISREVYEKTKGSVIRNDRGNLIAVYHATENLDFLRFLIGDVGFHFGTKEQAFYRAQDLGLKKGRVVGAYLNIKRPYDFGIERANWSPAVFAHKMLHDGTITEEQYGQIISLASENGVVQPYDSEANKMIRDLLEKAGYDGIIYDNLIEGDGKSYIAFYDDQIIQVEESIFEAAENGLDTNLAYISAFADEVGAFELIDNVCRLLSDAIKQDRAARYGWKNGVDITKSDPLFDEIVAALRKQIEAFCKEHNITARERRIAQEMAADEQVAPPEAVQGTGSVRFENGAEATTESQKQAVELARVVANAIGIDIVFYDSTIEGTYGSDANGFFNEADSSIHLDLQKNLDDRKTIAFTMSHELTHFIKKWSSEKFDTFAKFLEEQYGERGISMDELVKAKQEALGIEDPALAYEEVVCDACERMLLDSKAVEKLAALKQKDESLFRRIINHIRSLLKRIRAEYSKNNYAPQSTEAQALQQMEGVLDRFYELFEDAALDAAMNYQAAEGVMDLEGEVKYELKRDKSGKDYWHIDTSKDIFGNQTDAVKIKDAAYTYIIGMRDSKKIIDAIDGKQMTFIRVSAEDFTNSIESQTLLSNDPVMFAQKMRLIPSLEDMANNANISWWSPDLKSHKLFKQRGFENFRGRVGIDNVIFNFVIRAGKAHFGDVFYDINLE